MNDISRRRLMRKTAVGIGVTATMGGGAMTLENGPIQESEAVAPLIVAGAAAGSMTLGWALREYNVIGADAPAQGLTGSVLKENASNTIEARRSTNQSTFVDNRNLIDGVENSAYADGKMAAIDSLNNGATESDVLAAATAEVDAYEATVVKNLLKSWNESVNEMVSIGNTISNHGTVIPQDILTIPPDLFQNTDGIWKINSESRDLTMADGTTFSLKSIMLTMESSGSDHMTVVWDPLMYESRNDPNSRFPDFPYVPKDYNGTTELLNKSEWQGLYDDVLAAFQNARNGLSTWVTNIYSQVQAGELDTAELLTPRELSEMTADQEDYNRAISDLMALNVAVDLEREAEIYIPDKDATLHGSLSTTAETTITTGTIDPTADAFSYYFTYDVASGEGVWTAVNTSVDGGTVTFTKEPYGKTEFHIHTTSGETAVVTAADFTEDTTNGVWTADLSSKLDTAITNVDSVDYYANVDKTQYETIRLKNTFEVKQFTDSEGATYDSSDHTQATPQDDTNYITKEEWQAQEDRYQKLIDKYEQTKNTGGGGGGFLAGSNIGTPGLLAAGGAVLLAAFGLSGGS